MAMVNLNLKKKEMKINRIIYILFTLIILVSCSSNKEIMLDQFDGVSQVNEGDTLTINWAFNHAHYVTIKDIPQNFNPKDSLTFVPKRNTKLEFSAINEKDTMNLSWRIYLNVDEEKVVEEKEILKYTNSYIESDYFSGVHQDPKNFIPKNIKMMGYNDINDSTIEYKVLLLDEFGNYIPGIQSNDFLVWKITNSCGDYRDLITIDKYKEEKISDKRTAIKILLDNSKAAEYNQSLLFHIKDGLKKVNSNSIASLSVFNQDYLDIFDFKTIKDISNEDFKVEKNDGLNAIFKNAYKALAEMQFVRNSENKALILVTYSPNNAATIYNAKDLVSLARELSIPIYVISIGNAIDTYSMKYISYGTGGKFYNIDAADMKDISDIINEIEFAQNAYYKISVPKPVETDCEFYTLELKLNFNDNIIEDYGNYISNPTWFGNSHQSIAIFNYKNTELDPQYLSLITSITRVLKDNPQYSIELIGHSSIEDGKEENNIKISSDRVENIRTVFLEKGVPDYQIKSNSLGSAKPIYFLPSTEWQQHYNRRVEVRWIKPGDLPFEIIAQEYWTEEEAQKQVNEWQAKGFRSYFERYLVNNRPAYKVKLWGFESKDQALSEAKKLKASYKYDFLVE